MRDQSHTICSLLGCLLACALPFLANAQEYGQQTNATYGTTVEIPDDWIDVWESSNGASKIWFWRDGTSISTQAQLWEEIAGSDWQEFMRETENSLENEGTTITYADAGADWFVLSGLKQDTIFYMRVTTSSLCPELAHYVALQYPYEKRAYWNARVGRIARSLTATESTQCGGHTVLGEPYSTQEGREFVLFCNSHGFELRPVGPNTRRVADEGDPETLYLGNLCDSFSERYGSGTWCWGNGGFSTDFENGFFHFPGGQELTCEAALNWPNIPAADGPQRSCLC